MDTHTYARKALYIKQIYFCVTVNLVQLYFAQSGYLEGGTNRQLNYGLDVMGILYLRPHSYLFVISQPTKGFIRRAEITSTELGLNRVI